MKNPKCPYCENVSSVAYGREIYPHREDLRRLKFFICRPCDAYVGCHRKTGRPLGTLADSKLRYMRKLTHEAFDPLWKNNIKFTRTKAYKWLAKELGIKESKCHIAMFDKQTCLKVMKIAERRKNEKANLSGERNIPQR